MRGEARATETVPSRVPDAELPIYTILVPLYREAHMLAPLVLEAVDRDTLAAAQALHLPGNIEIIVVPELRWRLDS
jgi:hypothetical protein